MRKTVLFSALVALSASVFAGDYEAFDTRGAATTTSREQVQADLQQARRSGQMKVFSSTYNPASDFVSRKSREAVREELRASIASGEFAVLNASEVAVFPARQGDVTVTAHPVLAAR